MASIEEMDRLVAAMTEWERMPPPASAAEIVARLEADLAESRRRLDARMDAIRRTERVTVCLILAACLGLGMIPALLALYYGPPQRAEFLPEMP